jgi:hypothetical protein
MEHETWLPVPYEPFSKAYLVSNLGRVKPKQPSRYSKNGAEILKPAHSRKYMHVTLYADGQRCSYFIHRMVALAFIGLPPSPDMIVCHKNDDRTDNRAENLEWGTQQHNAATREAIGKTSRGVGNGRALLTEDDVRAIRARYAAGGVSQWNLAFEYGVTQTAITRLILRKTWAHVT